MVAILRAMSIWVRIKGCTLDQDSTWMEDLLGTPGAADKNQSRAQLRELISQADGLQICFKAYRLWERLDCVPDCLLVITEKWSLRVPATWMGPDCVEP